MSSDVTDSGFDRRGFLRRAAVVGAVATATPMITTFNAAHAQVGSGETIGDGGGSEGGGAANYRETVLDDNPTLYWRLGDAAGVSLVDDVSPNNHLGRVFGSPTLGVAGAIDDGNTAASFASGGAIVSDDPVYGATEAPFEYSIELWFKSASAGSDTDTVLATLASDSVGAYDRSLYLNNLGEVVFYHYSGGATLVTSTAAYNDGLWHHVVGTVDEVTVLGTPPTPRDCT